MAGPDHERDCDSSPTAVGTVRDDIAVGVRIARAEVSDLIRRKNTRREQVLFGLLVLLALPGVLLFVQQTYVLGRLTQDGVDAPVVAIARNLLLPAMLAMALFGSMSAAQSLARNPVRPLLLTSASTRAIVIGRVLYLLATWLVLFGLVFVLVLSYAIGAGAPLFLLAVVLAGVPLLLLTLLAGLALAYLLWLGIERLGLPEGLQRLVTASISMLAFVAAFAAGLLSGQVTGDQLPTGNPVVGLGWYADLLFLGSPAAEPLGLRTVLAALLVVVAIPALILTLERIAPAYWYATPALGPDDADDGTGDRQAIEFDQTPSEAIGRSRNEAGTLREGFFGEASLLAAFSGRSPTLRLARGYVRGAVRRPDHFVYLFYYLFPVVAVLIPLGLEVPGAVLPVVGLVLVVLGVWFAGGVFCLNPLGGEGAMLSQIVLAEESAERFVHARLLAGLAVGVPLALVGLALVVATGPDVSLSLLALAAGLVLAVVLTSACLALGLGSVLPKFETIEVFDSVETLAPSLIAAAVHGGFSVILLLGGVGVAVAATAPESPLPVSARIGLTVGFLLALWVLADGSRRYTVARLRDYGHPPRPDRPFAVYAALGLVGLGFILGQVLSLAAVLFLGVDLPIEVLLPALFVVEYVGYALVALGFLYVTRRGLDYLDVEWPSRGELGVIAGGVLASLALWAAAMAVVAGLGLPAADHALFDADDADPTLLLALIPLLLFVNGPIEELLFRNVVQKYLAEHFSMWSAVVMASVIFALVHVPAYLTAGLGPLTVTLVLLFVISCLWGAIYARTRSLVVVGAIHGLYNAILVGGLYVSLVWL